MKANNYLLSTEQLTDIGISKTTLTNYVSEGVLERCGHGYYTMPDSIQDDMYLLMLRSKHIVFSHETALFLNGLSERTPFIHSVTIPSNASLSASIKQNCNCYYIKPELYTLGLTELVNTFGNKVRCYDAERTICDTIRSRSRLDEETVLSAIKNYASYDDKDLNKLGKFADEFRISKQLRQYMEVLL
ncbi:MAG: type IV toxin-antitoxin system AbiEi family antitoxin domain-containing protein [Ruminococcaceae bacterium]|nr:type IV toxin-antitoxin system AbiEi family antitoxin domain-containing protein [Oscillospiraceae bacterium]